MYVPDFCATEAEFPATKTMGMNRDIWPKLPLRAFSSASSFNSIDCFFDARARPLDSATAVRLYSSNKGHDQGCLRRIYDSRSQNDFRNHSHYRADDSVRWIFLADLADEQGQRVHGESTATEFLPRWPRPRGRYRDFVTGLPDARGCGSSSNTYALVRSNRSATLRDSHFGGVLLSAAVNGYSSQGSGRLGLRPA